MNNTLKTRQICFQQRGHEPSQLEINASGGNSVFYTGYNLKLGPRVSLMRDRDRLACSRRAISVPQLENAFDKILRQSELCIFIFNMDIVLSQDSEIEINQ